MRRETAGSDEAHALLDPAAPTTVTTNGRAQRDLFHLPVSGERLTSRLFRWRQAILESDLRPTVRLVAWTLSAHMNDRGGSCYPTHATIAREAGLRRTAVREAVYELRDKGWLDVEETIGTDGEQRSNNYVARVPAKGLIP